MDRDLLKRFAAKYIWWKTSEDALNYPHRIITQVMNIGTWNDVQLLLTDVGEQQLTDVLVHSEAGEFDARSWNYWHLRLGLADEAEHIPPLPRRKIFQVA